MSHGFELIDYLAPPRRSTPIRIRWMIRRDMPAALAAEALGRPDGAWGEETFLRELRRKNVIGMVATGDSERPLGHMVYALERGHLDLLRLTVAPEWRGQGVGRALVNKLKAKLSPVRRRAIVAAAPEGLDYAGPRFLRACGFLGVGVEPGACGPKGGDGIVMTFGWRGGDSDA